MKDFRGTEVEPGDIVVYPGTVGSSLWVSEAVVVEILEKKRPYRDETYETVKVRRIRESGYGGKAREVDPIEKVLQRPDRLVVVEKNRMGE